MTAHFLWYCSPSQYQLELFIGPNTQRRRFAGVWLLTPEQAVFVRTFVVSAAIALDPTSFTEVGWTEPTVA